MQGSTVRLLEILEEGGIPMLPHGPQKVLAASVRLIITVVEDKQIQVRRILHH